MLAQDWEQAGKRRSRSRGLLPNEHTATLAMDADDSSERMGTASDQPPSGSPWTLEDMGASGLWG